MRTQKSFQNRTNIWNRHYSGYWAVLKDNHHWKTVHESKFHRYSHFVQPLELPSSDERANPSSRKLTFRNKFSTFQEFHIRAWTFNIFTNAIQNDPISIFEEEEWPNECCRERNAKMLLFLPLQPPNDLSRQEVTFERYRSTGVLRQLS